MEEQNLAELSSISIIIPAWNRANTIKQCLDSIPCNDKIEVIVVDDGSTDNTKEVIENYTRIPIKYFYQENQGPGPARDLGVANATKDYVFFLDSDDELYGDNFLKALTICDRADETKLKYACNQKGADNTFHYEMQGNIIKRSILDGIKHIPGRFRGEDTLYSLMIEEWKHPTVQEVDLVVYKYNVGTTDNSLSNTLTKGDKRMYFYYKQLYKL